ncbi:MAG: hypothetical protein ABIJ86_12745 [Spirochaetota bacterium]
MRKIILGVSRLGDMDGKAPSDRLKVHDVFKDKATVYALVSQKIPA